MSMNGNTKEEKSYYAKGFHAGKARKSEIMREAQATIEAFDKDLSAMAEKIQEYTVLRLVGSSVYSQETVEKIRAIAEDIASEAYGQIYNIVQDRKELLKKKRKKK